MKRGALSDATFARVQAQLGRILRLSFLAPEVVKTILRDRHPLELTAKKLAGDTRLPIAWEEQRARFGIA